MTLTDINKMLAEIAEQKTREKILEFSFGLLKWIGIAPNGENKPQLLATQTQKLREYLANAPQTLQAQLYRMSADGQNIRVRFAVLKKLKKEYINQLVDNDPGLTSYQASVKGIINIPGRPEYIPSQPYYIHFVTTPAYDKLVLIFNQGEQKRILIFRNRLSQTQFDKILPAWQNISTLSKPEIAKFFWDSLDVKEVNKEFYKHIKEQFDSLIDIAKSQNKDFDESITKQFAVRLIGRYIFCWFLKEKEIIPEALISSETIEKYKDTYFQTLLSKLFFKTLNAEVTNSARIETLTVLDDLYKNIPYLNGGLFDWHPEDKLFEILDLNEWLIKFVSVLENFDFTVDESSSQYQHVAIDPEMLGRIFENLLASQNPDTEKMANQRKAFGAFYTPREIVDYMVNESLKAFVETQLFPQLPGQADKVSEAAIAIKGTLFQDVVDEPKPTIYNQAEIAENERIRERLKIKIDKLFAPDCVENPFDKDETIRLRKALTEIRVLDPACGSGAFPMGVMLRLMELRQIIGHGHRNNYDLKEEILSKNIFGVDIMPMAVEIARLRAWLSLVLESDYKSTDRKNNFGIAALPNLDFKFVCANSLIDSGYDAFLEKSHHNATLYRLDGEIQKLERLRNSYFDPQGDKNKKEELQKEFLKTKDYIKTAFISLKKNWNLEDFLSKVDDWNPFDDSHPSSFFSPAWMFGIRNGFDVVIGNPPYISAMELKKSLPELIYRQLKSDYQSAKGAVDLYIYFFERGLKLLKNGAPLVYISPNRYLSASYGEAMREFLFQQAQIIEIIDYSHVRVFKDASIYPVVTTLRKNESANKLYPISIGKYDDKSEKVIFKKVTSEKLNFLEGFIWGYLLNEKINITEKVINQSVLITNCAKINATSTASEADYYHNLINDNEGFKLINTGTIDRYESLWGKSELTDKGKRFLTPYLTNRTGKISKNRTNLYGSPKIILAKIAITTEAFFDAKGEYASVNTNCIHSFKEDLDPRYILAWLNSKLFQYTFECFFEGLKMQGGYLLYSSPNVSKMFIKKVAIKNQMPLIELVEKIFPAKAQKQDTSILEKEIDVLVYKLYELTYEEVKIIDKDFWLSEEEYNAIKL
jgi:hypothetical protein